MVIRAPARLATGATGPIASESEAGVDSRRHYLRMRGRRSKPVRSPACPPKRADECLQSERRNEKLGAVRIISRPGLTEEGGVIHPELCFREMCVTEQFIAALGGHS